ncbi:type II CRISPR RNA-guided endonuclease Cas9 [uncultured Bacteroides sp.]|uniref:type II CRISPR RNA-guided endonuclease Cas9 n=1 Tax=uncultured Bacteroides sp. TaxID=162156 RepID=UPI002631727F|nr:type II CRISPR RNA-guided endonuclease Cas9 [uncultured Bacteroides sp.]
MEKRLGIDMGTNSLGWALVEMTEEGCVLLDRGVDIFQEGVAHEKGGERPAVQDRTDARALRRHYFRRRLRKIALLRVLVQHDFCPPLSQEQLDAWRKQGVYPVTDEFIRWQRTDDAADKNPYRDRFRALTEELDLTRREDRHALGRALYHLCQRRGFLSNRKDAGNETEDGTVKTDIKALSADMEAAGCTWLGEYFYRLYQRKEKIRSKHYTARNEHYLAEFRAICRKQRLGEELQQALERAIFYQRPLKSQKGQVGRCRFEKKKSRCPVSHPRFEEFRMLQFLNNVRVTGPGDAESRPLSQQELEAVRPLFLRKSKPHFDFEDIAKKIAGRNNYACKGDRTEAAWRFNFARGATVTGCPMSALLEAVFGNEWRRELCRLYTLGAGKSEERIIDDVWHALFAFEHEERLRQWLQEKLQISADDAKTLAAFRLPQGYASLSLNVINKILPYLRRGYRYDEAVFFANLGKVLPAEVYADPARRREVEQGISAQMDDLGDGEKTRKEERIRDYLRLYWGVEEERLDRLYHPSMIEAYPQAKPDANGILRLGSPRTAAVRNPMAMRALFRLRALINELLREGKIDRGTRINIEFSRKLNDANMRKAIERYQREREAENRKFAAKIREEYAAATGHTIEPTEEDLLKYRLWEEQNHIDLYSDTGRMIGIAEFLGAGRTYDIEHTVPRSRGGEDAQYNKTLCEERFNREVKRNKLPMELACGEEIWARIEALGWPELIDSLQGQIEGATRRVDNAVTKPEKDEAIQYRHYLKMRRDYWRRKCESFKITEVPEGFSNRQGVDIGIIGKYARQYLQTVFDRVYPVKGSATADFRTMWGLQEEHTRKERVNHVHHCIDAITIACIGKREYDRWARYVCQDERYRRGEADRPQPEKPWPTFTEDVRAVAEELLVSHHTPDNMPKQSRKRLRVRGRVQKNDKGETKYMQGDTARGALHEQTFYGAIEREGEIRYVVRKSLDQLLPTDVDKIVDETVKRKVQEAIEAFGFKEAMDPQKHTVWMNKDKNVPIRKVRILTGVKNPILLKPHRDVSVKEYKRYYHVVNDGNYCMAIYEGRDRQGRLKRTFEIVNKLEAARYFKRSADRESRPDLVPLSDVNGYSLKYLLKTGTMVLFYENSPDELYECSVGELAKRLYKVVGMAQDGRVQFLFHQEARDRKAVTAECGMGISVFDARHPAPKLRIRVSNFKMFVEGYDFELTVTGEVKFKR